MMCHGAVFRSWLAARLLSVMPEHPSVMPERPSVMPGLVPGIHFRRSNGPDGDARNKSGHDVKGHDERRAGAAAGTPAGMS